MKRYEIQKFGIDYLTPVEVPMPDPPPHHVLVRVNALSLNYRDLMVVDGRYNPRMPLPRVPFSDAAGAVERVGDGVTRVRAGDRVASSFMQEWIDGEVDLEKSRTALGGAIDGVLAEYVVLHEDGVVRVPEHLTDEEAATLPCAALTAWNALTRDGGVNSGTTLLLQGTGGVSIFALQFAKVFGARVIMISSSDEKLARARELGADELVNYATTPDWEKAAKTLTGGVGVDHVIEVGGAGTMNRSLAATRIAGRVSVIGALSGGAGEIQTTQILMKSLTLQGIFVGSRAMFEAMNATVAKHQLRPVIDRVFAFNEVREALRYMESGRHFGKIVVRGQ